MLEKRQFFCVSLLVLLLFNLVIAGISPNNGIIPWPQSFEDSGSKVVVIPQIYIDDSSLNALAGVLVKDINKATQIECKIVSSISKAGIICINNAQLETDEYKLDIEDGRAILQASSYHGFVYATASLIQLVGNANGQILLPTVKIQDSPDFPFRSVMLDTARFWQPPHTLKETKDLAYLLNFNYMHLHLTDDQSFTFPSEAFPQVKSYFADGTRRHYTIEELKDIVEYARIRGIAIIPSIDVPAHAGILIRSMPEIFGMKDSKTGNYKPIGNVVNMVNEKTYETLNVLFGEVADVFSTSPYIHVGADEVNSAAMKQLPEYQGYVEKYGLKNAAKGDARELYAHFVVRMNDIVKKHGKQMIAWEGFHGTGSENAHIPNDIIVMAWNNSYNPPEQLLKNGYTVINASWKPMYIVPPQNSMDSQKTTYDWDIYNFEDHNRAGIPYFHAPEDSAILGAQICFWEQTYEAVFPALRQKMPVVSERIWNRNAGCDFADFEKRFKRSDDLAGRLSRPVSIKVDGLLADSKESVSFDKKVTISLNSDVPGTIRYRLDDEWGNFPDATSLIYNSPLMLDESKVVTAAVFDENDNLVGNYTQQKYSKITPAYKYTVLGEVPKGGWLKMPDFSTLTPLRTGVLGYADARRMHELNSVVFAKAAPYGHIDTQPFQQTNPFALELKGQLRIPETGNYLFQIRSPFGMAKIYIGRTCIAQYEGSGKGITTGKLEAGVYPFRIEYFYSMVQNVLNIQMKLDGQDKFEPFEQYVLPITDWKQPAELNRIYGMAEFGKYIEKKYMSLATNKPVTCSGGTQNPNVPENAVDGDITNESGWHSSSSGQWFQFDLEKIETIDRIKLYTYYDNHRHYRYFIEVSTDGKSFTEVVDQRGNTLPSSSQGVEHTFNPIKARYVRVTMTYNSANPGVHINELMVFAAE